MREGGLVCYWRGGMYRNGAGHEMEWCRSLLE